MPPADREIDAHHRHALCGERARGLREIGIEAVQVREEKDEAALRLRGSKERHAAEAARLQRFGRRRGTGSARQSCQGGASKTS